MSGDIVGKLRKIASRGRMDDADVQVVFDAADEIERLRAALRLACVEVFGFCDPLATSPDELAESYINEARRER